MNQRKLDEMLANATRASVRPKPEELDRLCDVYWSADSDGRAQFRDAFDSHSWARLFRGYFLRVYTGLRDTGDPVWLRRGLAAHSIEDNRTDWRDVLVALSDLWLRAEESGIDPSIAYQEGAARSNDRPRYGDRSMSGLMASVQSSACLTEMRGGSGRARQ